jgi:hypothetical protein
VVLMLCLEQTQPKHGDIMQFYTMVKNSRLHRTICVLPNACTIHSYSPPSSIFNRMFLYDPDGQEMMQAKLLETRTSWQRVKNIWKVSRLFQHPSFTNGKPKEETILVISKRDTRAFMMRQCSHKFQPLDENPLMAAARAVKAFSRGPFYQPVDYSLKRNLEKASQDKHNGGIQKKVEKSSCTISRGVK